MTSPESHEKIWAPGLTRIQNLFGDLHLQKWSSHVHFIQLSGIFQYLDRDDTYFLLVSNKIKQVPPPPKKKIQRFSSFRCGMQHSVDFGSKNPRKPRLYPEAVHWPHELGMMTVTWVCMVLVGVVGQFWLFGLLGKIKRINMEDWIGSLPFSNISFLLLLIGSVQLRENENDPIWQVLVCLNWVETMCPYECNLLNESVSISFPVANVRCFAKAWSVCLEESSNQLLCHSQAFCTFLHVFPSFRGSTLPSEKKWISNKLWQLWEGSLFATQDFCGMTHGLLWELCLFLFRLF